MKTVGIYEAKTHLTSLLERVGKGESVIITRHGKPVARLAPLTEPTSAARSIESLLEDFRKIRASAKPGPSIRELIEEGRRY